MYIPYFLKNVRTHRRAFGRYRNPGRLIFYISFLCAGGGTETASGILKIYHFIFCSLSTEMFLSIR